MARCVLCGQTACWEVFAICFPPGRCPTPIRSRRFRSARCCATAGTEDQIINDLDLANDVAEALREPKCDLAVDDFGAGYSSLVRLKQLPLSELKIDRSYVANCNEDHFNADLCETIVELGRRFGLRTVAEGIETTRESHKLQSIGCQIGQGYLFAKPMRKGDFLTLLRARVKGAGMPQTAHARRAQLD